MIATHDLAFARGRATHVLLLGGRQIAFGVPERALTADCLRAAYGGRLVILDATGAPTVVDDGSHCGHGHSHGSPEPTILGR